MSNDHFTLMIVPDAHDNVRRVQITKRRVWSIVIGALMVAAMVSTVMVHYAFLVGERFAADALRKENAALKSELLALATTIDGIDTHLQDVRRFDEKLRTMTDLNDDGRELALGPLRQPSSVGGSNDQEFPFAHPLPGDDPASEKLRTAILDSRLMGLSREASRQAENLGALVDHLNAREAVLSSTPSVWPVRGWMTSSFGPREDPFTGERIMHLGLDIASLVGATVRAPADGLVVFAGDRGAYGNMIAIDHGRGIVTHYAHLSSMKVTAGEVVRRGQETGTVGNTGRSTGPHLHYEVRVNGIPVNPHRFVLE